MLPPGGYGIPPDIHPWQFNLFPHLPTMSTSLMSRDTEPSELAGSMLFTHVPLPPLAHMVSPGMSVDQKTTPISSPRQTMIVTPHHGLMLPHTSFNFTYLLPSACPTAPDLGTTSMRGLPGYRSDVPIPWSVITPLDGDSSSGRQLTIDRSPTFQLVDRSPQAVHGQSIVRPIPPPTHRLLLPPPVPDSFSQSSSQPNIALALEALPSPPRLASNTARMTIPPRITGWVPPEDRPLPPKVDDAVPRIMGWSSAMCGTQAADLEESEDDGRDPVQRYSARADAFDWIEVDANAPGWWFRDAEVEGGLPDGSMASSVTERAILAVLPLVGNGTEQNTPVSGHTLDSYPCLAQERTVSLPQNDTNYTSVWRRSTAEKDAKAKRQKVSEPKCKFVIQRADTLRADEPRPPIPVPRLRSRLYQAKRSYGKLVLRRPWSC